MWTEDNVRRGFFERTDFEKLREALRSVVTLAYYNGWRKTELLTLEWRQVDLTAGTITLDTSKNGQGRTFVFNGLTDVQTLTKQRKLPVVTTRSGRGKEEERLMRADFRATRRPPCYDSAGMNPTAANGRPVSPDTASETLASRAVPGLLGFIGLWISLRGFSEWYGRPSTQDLYSATIARNDLHAKHMVADAISAGIEKAVIGGALLTIAVLVSVAGRRSAAADANPAAPAQITKAPI